MADLDGSRWVDESHRLGNDDFAPEGLLTFGGTCLLESHLHLPVPGHPGEAAGAIEDFPAAGLHRVAHLVRTWPKADLQLAVGATEHIDGWVADLKAAVFVPDGSARAEGGLTYDGSCEHLALESSDPGLDEDRLPRIVSRCSDWGFGGR